jgi:hypothetical protein
VTIDTRGSDFDTVLAAYTVPALGTRREVASDDDIVDGQDQDSEIGFDATAGTTYWIAVDGFNQGGGADTGAVRLRLVQTGGDAADPPETYFSKRPPRVARNRSVMFAFRSNDPNASFQCLYSSGWKECTSPVTFRRLRPGAYSLKVRAVSGGRVDPTPAAWNFRIRPRR